MSEPAAELSVRPRSSAAALLAQPVVFGSLIPVVTGLNAVVGMLLPQLMEPRVFGEFSLVATLFNYGLIFDLGISQIIDRLIPANLGRGRPDLARQIGDKLLWARLEIAITTFLLAAATLWTLHAAQVLPFSFWSGVLASLAGLANMVALGPTCIYRASSQRSIYAVLTAMLLSGLIFARLGGLLLAGPTGCFAALALWYTAGAYVTHARLPLRSDARPRLWEVVRLFGSGLPLFATSFSWSFYVTGNRWIASLLIPADKFGEFAFSANIFSLLVGAIGAFSAFYYPKIAEQIAKSAPRGLSPVLRRDLSRLVAGQALLMAVGIVSAGVLIAFIYPRYVGSISTARIMLVAVPPMVLAAWLMPLSLSTGKRPWVNGIFVYPVAIAFLAIGMNILYRWLGEDGAAWASTASALLLNAMQLGVLIAERVLRLRDAAVLLLVTSGICAALAGLVLLLAR